MTNYNNGKIYKIQSHLGDKIYIGSTTKQYLSQRMTAHKTHYNAWKAEKRTKVTSFELYPCDSKDQLISREAHYNESLFRAF